MKMTDPLYGTFEIEPVLAELIQSPLVSRLAHVHQGGSSYLVNPLWDLSRLDHSIGVMLFIRKFGGSLEEQIAGLLHDVSHTAFSHVVDYALDFKEEDYHEQIFEDFVKTSTIPAILEKYGYSFEGIFDDISKWKILEQEAPELCADRIDYTLQDLYRHRKISLAEVEEFLQALVMVDGRLYLANIASAEWFVAQYYSEVIDYFYDPLNVYSYEILAEAMRIAFQQETITTADLRLTDAELLAKLNMNSDAREKIQLLASPHLEENEADFTYHHKKKMRLINPSVLVDGRLISADELSENVREMNREAKIKSERGVYIKVIQKSKQ
ncbi:HD domain-containing protein [Listeria innocua]|nr:HD domain-containing protein [Listeria innocua]EAG8524169.1 HD domain-containing protein [Listeria innocua]EHF3590094.1 HD domain-containing protein [Listeria innocua]EIL5148412.1 HD domain-containing protein [Listeria innocua]EIL5151220.1 HD domain-containing protein [Listeria innocua]